MSARDDYPSLYEFASRAASGHDQALIAKRGDAWGALSEIDRLRSKLAAIGKLVAAEEPA